jgi:hypothetical protein
MMETACTGTAATNESKFWGSACPCYPAVQLLPSNAFVQFSIHEHALHSYVFETEV